MGPPWSASSRGVVGSVGLIIRNVLLYVNNCIGIQWVTATLRQNKIGNVIARVKGEITRREHREHRILPSRFPVLRNWIVDAESGVAAYADIVDFRAAKSAYVSCCPRTASSINSSRLDSATRIETSSPLAQAGLSQGLAAAHSVTLNLVPSHSCDKPNCSCVATTCFNRIA